MRNRKRLLSWILVLVMLFSLAPASAFASEDAEQLVKIECNVPTAEIKVYSASDPETEIGCHGDGVYRLTPGEYFYTATEDINGYDPVGPTPFTVVDGDNEPVTFNMTKTVEEDGNPAGSDDGADEDLENPDAQGDGQDLAPDLQDLITEDPKITNTVTLSQGKDEEKHELLQVRVTGGEYP